MTGSHEVRGSIPLGSTISRLTNVSLRLLRILALHRSKKIIKIAIVIGLLLVVPILCVEMLMIVLDPYLFKDRFEYDPDLGFRARAYFLSKPGTMGEGDDGTLSNRFGFNDRDYPLTKEPGTFRILVVGDSYGWGGGLKANYTALLENYFEARDGFHKIDVVNTGYPGTHTGEQLVMLKKYGLQYNPDLVILGFFAGNDFTEADPNRKRIVVNGCQLDIDKRHEYRLFGYPIITQSRLLLFLTQKYGIYSISKQARKEAREWADANRRPVPTKNLPQAVFYRVEKANLDFFNKQTSAERFAVNINYIFHSIAAMNDLLKSRNIKFMVAIYPDAMQVNPKLFDTLISRFGLNRENYDLNLAQDTLRTFLASNQIPYVDLTDRFRAEEQQRELYLFDDPHWNRAGNELAAEMLFQYLNQQPDGRNLMAH